MVNSKNKGGNFERNFSKQLSLWLSNGEHDDWCWRSASSGARATQRGKQGKTTQGGSGDLTFVHEAAAPFFNLFSVELKVGYNDTNPLMEIDSSSKTHDFRANLNQAMRDAKLAGKEPLLIFKRDRMSTCVCMLKERFNHMVDYFGNLAFDIRYLELYDGDDNFIIFKIEDFFNWANPEYFTEIKYGK